MALATVEAMSMIDDPVFDETPLHFEEAPEPGALRSYRATDGNLYPWRTPLDTYDSQPVAAPAPAWVDGYVGRVGALCMQRDMAFAEAAHARGDSQVFFDAQEHAAKAQYLHELQNSRPSVRDSALGRYERRLYDLAERRTLAMERADAELARLQADWADTALFQRASTVPEDRRSRIQSLLSRTRPLTRRFLGRILQPAAQGGYI